MDDVVKSEQALSACALDTKILVAKNLVRNFWSYNYMFDNILYGFNFLKHINYELNTECNICQYFYKIPYYFNLSSALYCGIAQITDLSDRQPYYMKFWRQLILANLKNWTKLVVAKISCRQN